MVTKLYVEKGFLTMSLILAKIHMVTKHEWNKALDDFCLILAKIHMVTKPQIHNSIYLKTNKS